jgi:hypothetical protein
MPTLVDRLRNINAADEPNNMANAPALRPSTWRSQAHFPIDFAVTGPIWEQIIPKMANVRTKSNAPMRSPLVRLNPRKLLALRWWASVITASVVMSLDALKLTQ